MLFTILILFAAIFVRVTRASNRPPDVFAWGLVLLVIQWLASDLTVFLILDVGLLLLIIRDFRHPITFVPAAADSIVISPGVPWRVGTPSEHSWPSNTDKESHSDIVAECHLPLSEQPQMEPFPTTDMAVSDSAFPIH